MLEKVLNEVRTNTPVPFASVSLMNYVRRHDIRIIHGTDRPRDAAYAMSLARLTGAKAIVHVHVAWSNWYSAPAKWGVRRADAVFSISRFVTDTIVATGTPRERVHTILNGIDPSKWDPHVEGGAVRRELGIPPEAPLLVSVSRLFAQKGQRELLQAIPRVGPAVPNVCLPIVGPPAREAH